MNFSFNHQVQINLQAVGDQPGGDQPVGDQPGKDQPRDDQPKNRKRKGGHCESFTPLAVRQQRRY